MGDVERLSCYDVQRGLRSLFVVDQIASLFVGIAGDSETTEEREAKGGAAGNGNDSSSNDSSSTHTGL
jgi:hypothetical protein